MTRQRNFSHSRSTLIALAIASAAAAGGLSGSATAATYVWTGSASTDWTLAGNWTGATPPPANNLTGDIAQFNTAAYTNQPAVLAARSVSGLLIDSTSGALDIAGPGLLSVGGAGITMNAGAAAAIIDAPLNANYFPGAPASAGQNTETWVNNSANSLTLTAAFTHQAGSILNIEGTGAITTVNLNTNGILGTWATFGTGAATKYATNLTNAAGGTIGGLVGTVATDVNAMTDNTANDELTNTGPNALTNSTLAASGTANTIRYAGTAQTIQLGAAVTLATKGILNVGPGTLTFTNPTNDGGVALDSAETVFNAAGGNIEFTAPVINTSASTSSITVTGPGKVGFNAVSNLGAGLMTFQGLGDHGGTTPSSKMMIGASHTLTLNAVDGDLRIFSPIVDNQDGMPSAVVVNTTGANRVRLAMGNNANTGFGTYSGGLTLTAGSNLEIGSTNEVSDSSLGTGTFTINPGATIFNAATFSPLNNNAQTWAGDFGVTTSNNATYSTGTGLITMAPSNPAATSITITNNGINDPFNDGGIEIGPAGTSTNTLLLTDGGRGLGLTLAGATPGAGSIRLNGIDNFTGPLNIESGKVFINNDKAMLRDTVVILNAGSTLQLGSRTNEMMAGLQDGTGGGGEVIQLSSGDALYWVGSGSYSFSGDISGGGNPSNVDPVMAGTGTQTLAGASTYTYATSKNGFTAIYSGTLKLDFNAITAPPSNILYHNVQAQFLSLGSGKLLVNGNSSAPSSQSFADITVGGTSQGRPFNGSATVQLVNIGQDVALKLGNIYSGAGGGANFVLPAGSQTATNGVLTTASNFNGILSDGSTTAGGLGAAGRGNVVVTSGGSTDWAMSNATHIAPGTTVESTPGTYDSLDGNLDIWTGTLATPSIGQGVSFNTVPGALPSGIEAGQLFYVATTSSFGGNNYFSISLTPGGTPVLNNGNVTGALSIDVQGNLVPLPSGSYNTSLMGNGPDSPTANYLLTGSLTPAAGVNDVVNSLKIANTAPGSLDFKNIPGSLFQMTNGALLFTGTADYSITDTSVTPGVYSTYRLNGLNNEFIVNQYGTGNLTFGVRIRNNSLTKNGPGTLTLTNPLSDFTPALNLNGGTVAFTSLHALGIGTSIVFNGGTLQYAAGYAGPSDITLGGGVGNPTSFDPQGTLRTVTISPGGATIDTNGNNVAFSRSIGGGDVNGFFGGGVAIPVPTGGLTKVGAGTLSLAPTNAYGGGTTISGGTLSVGSLVVAGRFGNTASGTTLTLNQTNALVVGQSVTGSMIAPGTTISAIVDATHVTLSLAPTALFTPLAQTTQANSQTNTDTSLVVGSTAGLQIGQIVTGTGIQANTYIAAIVDATHLTLSQATTATAAITATFTFNLAGTTTASSATVALPSTTGLFPGQIVSGPGVFVGTTVVSVDSPTQVTVSLPIGTGFPIAALKFSGAMIGFGNVPSAGLANGGQPSAIGISSNAAENLILDGGTLQYTGSVASTDRNFTLTQNGGSLDASGAANASLAFTNNSPIATTGSGARTLTLTGSSTGANSLALGIGDGTGGATSVVKNGAGTWLLNGTSTYTGTTTVNAGTLGGSGTLASTVVAGSAAHTIAPSAGLVGNTATTFTVGGLTTNANTTLAFNLLTPGASSVSDRINVTGNNKLTLSGGALAITNNNTGLASLGYYKVMQYSGSIQGTGITSVVLPAAVNHVAYVLDTAHDPGFVDVHRGLQGDANDDGLVNFADFVLLSNNFTATNKGWGGADFNGDGITNFADFVILSNNFGATIGAAEVASFGATHASGVPEPTSLALLGAGLLGVIGARRRTPAR